MKLNNKRTLTTIAMIAAFAAVGVASSAKVFNENNVADTAVKPGRCLLVVDGTKYINGRCEIEMDKGGSFQIYEKGKRGYFAYVNLTDDGAEGWWNEERTATHAHSSLGTLTRNGACWENDRAKVCAWR